jgi:pyruvate,water dikinase
MMTKPMILFFNEIKKEDVPIVGGKNANLGEMTTKVGVPVPPGYAITAAAYRFFTDKNKLNQKISSELKKVLDPNDTKTLKAVGATIRKTIIDAPVPVELRKAIIDAYLKLSEGLKEKDPFVAVRSSATAEDLPGASFAGQQETYLNVKGTDQLIDKVRECFASLYTDRAIFYRIQKGFAHEKVALSVAIQKMVNSKSAGVLFTLDPATGDTSKIIIEGTWGLGEAVVSGAVTPDHYIVDKVTSRAFEKELALKKVEYIRNPKTGQTIHAKVPKNRQKGACLTDAEIKKLCEYALTIERHYGSPQDIEWAIDRDTSFPKNVFIVQSRPETVWFSRKKETQVGVARTTLKPVVKGLAASPGIIAGVVKVVPNVSQINRVQDGDVLVTRMTTPDWVPAMRKAKAIITEEGGTTCHAAIVSRELGIPCIVGTGNAMSLLVDGMQYTVDAKSGNVYEGVIDALLEKKPPETLAGPYIPTRTKVYMNLGVPEKIEDYKKLPFDGIGLMRIEFIIASYVHQHPLDLIEKGQEQKYIEKLAEGISMAAKAIAPKPIVVRFSDFKSNEYRALKGGEQYETEEANPMIGWRGVSRYVSPDFEKAFRLECKAMKKVREEMGCTNVWVMFPFVRTTDEVKKAIAIMESEGLKRSKDFKIWLMLEVPSVALIIEDFAKLPIDGFSIGSNDLTQLILGIDRDSERLGTMGYFDERNPAVLKAIEMSIKGALKAGKTISICGQAPSVYPEITEFLVKHNVTSVSVNPDTVVKTRQLIAQIEKKKR